MIGQHTSRLFGGVFSLACALVIGCGSSTETTAPSAQDINDFLRDNPQYADQPESETETIKDPETGKEVERAKTLELGS